MRKDGKQLKEQRIPAARVLILKRYRMLRPYFPLQKDVVDYNPLFSPLLVSPWPRLSWALFLLFLSELSIISEL